MEIFLTKSFQDYQAEKKFTAITVNTAASRGSCCKIMVPKIIEGKPEKSLDKYDTFDTQGLTLYISKNLKLENTITFSHQVLFGRGMLEMKGFAITHYANS